MNDWIDTWGEDTTFPCRKTPNNIYRHSTLKEREPESPLLKCGLHLVTFLQRVQSGKHEGRGKDINFTVEKLINTASNTTSGRWPRLTSTVKNQVESVLRSVWYTRKMALSLCGLSLQNLWPKSNHKKTYQANFNREVPCSTLDQTPQSCQSHKKQGSLRNWQSQKESKRTYD